MLTRSQINHIKQLSDKKYRTEQQQFVVEGEKMVLEALGSGWTVLQCIATEDWFQETNYKFSSSTEQWVAKPAELERMSQWQTPQRVIAVLQIPSEKKANPSGFHLVLDRIQDPGNMGTILRIADWYGITEIYSSLDSADQFNSKVIQSSMGSIFRVDVIATDLHALLIQHPSVSIYAAALNGTPLQQVAKSNQGFLILGNESKGIQESLMQLATQQITIPRKGKAESLNVAVAAGIICHHLLS